MRPAALSCFCKPLAQVCIFSLLACSAAGMEGGPPASQKCTGMDKCDDPLVFKCDIGASRSGFRALKSVLTEEGINDDTTQHALSSVVRAMRGKADDVSVGDVHSLGSLMAVPSEVWAKVPGAMNEDSQRALKPLLDTISALSGAVSRRSDNWATRWLGQDMLISIAAGLLGVESVEDGDLLPRVTMRLLAPDHRKTLQLLYSRTMDEDGGSLVDLLRTTLGGSEEDETDFDQEEEWVACLADTLEVPCEDLSENCQSWASQGECDTNAAYMLENCRLSCGGCKSSAGVQSDLTAGATGAACVDEDDSCKEWAAIGECDKNKEYMASSCPVSCGICKT